MRYFFCFIVLLGVLSQSKAQNYPLETIVQTGHYESIEVLKFSQDGKYLISGSQDNSIKLWELSTGREIRTFSGSQSTIRTIDINADNSLIVSVNNDSTAWIWDINSGKVVRKIQPKGDFVNNAIFSPDGKNIITGGKEHNITVWNTESWEIEYQLKGTPIGCYSGACLVSLQMNKRGDRLVTGISNYSAILWDLSSREIIAEVKGSRSSCSSCMLTARFTHDEKQFVTLASGDSVRFWDAKTGNSVRNIFLERRMRTIEVSKDGKYFSTLDYGIFQIHDINTGEVIHQVGESGNKMNAVAYSPDGKTVALAGDKKTILMLNLSTFKVDREYSGVVNHFEDNLKSSVRFWVKNKSDQKVSPDGKYIAQGKIGNIARLWDLATGRIIRDFTGHDGTVVDVAFSPDGKLLATASGDRTARIWEVATGNELHTLKFHTAALFSVAFSRNGEKLITSGWDGMAVAWDVEEGFPEFRYKSHENYGVIEATFTPSGLYVITGGLDQKLVMTELDTGTPVREFIGHSHDVPSIEFSPDGRYMLTGSWDGLAKLWDLFTGYQVARYDGHDREVNDVAISNDGKFILTAGGDKKIIQWEALSGKVVKVFEGHLGAVTSVAFSPDGKRIISGSRDGTTKVWDIASGAVLYTHVFTGEKEWMAMVPSGHFYATEGAKESIFFVRGKESYNIERFFDDYYRPGLIKSIDQAKDRGKDMNLVDQLEKFPPPEIEVIAPKPPYPADQKSLGLVIRIRNTGGGIQEVKVTHNGKRVIDDRKDLERVNKAGKTIVKSYDLDLVPGRNDFRVTAFSNGRIESRETKINIMTEGDVSLSDCHILAIGINEYSNPALNLNYAQADANAFVDELRKRGKKLYNKIYVHEIYNRDATKENILAKVEELKSSIGANDVFYFFYAGHGTLVDQTFFFVPTDVVRLFDKPILEDKAISAERLKSYFADIKALKQVMVLDACHSGGSTEILAERGAGEEKALAQLSRSAGIHVLAAAGSQQTAAEFSELGHGLFTYMILEALSGKADGAPMDDKVTVYELKSFLDDRVPEYSEKYKGTPQYPSTFSRGHDFPLSFGKDKKDN